MLDFPRCPKWAAGESLSIPLHGDCVLHIPIALCATQLDRNQFVAKVERFVTAQMPKPVVDIHLLTKELDQVRMDYDQLAVSAKQLEAKHNAIIAEINKNKS